MENQKQMTLIMCHQLTNTVFKFVFWFVNDASMHHYSVLWFVNGASMHHYSQFTKQGNNNDK